MTQEPMTFPCRYEMSSHQFFEKGICHGIGINPNGRPFALIEKENGEVDVQYLGERYHIKLIPMWHG